MSTDQIRTQGAKRSAVGALRPVVSEHIESAIVGEVIKPLEYANVDMKGMPYKHDAAHFGDG
jgi:hypothetical protein